MEIASAGRIGDLRGELIVATALFGILTASLAVALAVARLALVQRLVPLPIRQAHNAAIGVIYAASACCSA
jgi:hypothetical protein